MPQAEADYAGTRIVIAARQYIDRHGGLPAELQNLVDDGLLKEVPIDPFSGKPMRYSRRRGIVWSFWYTAKDHNGREPRNRVWRLPKAT